MLSRTILFAKKIYFGSVDGDAVQIHFHELLHIASLRWNHFRNITNLQMIQNLEAFEVVSIKTSLIR